MWDRWLSGKLWYLQHFCTGDAIVYPKTSGMSIMWYPWLSIVVLIQINCMMTSSNGNIFRVTGRYWSFVQGIHRSPVNSPHKGQWRGALMFSLICTWTNGWVNNREAGDLRHHRTHYDVIIMETATKTCRNCWAVIPPNPTPAHKKFGPPVWPWPLTNWPGNWVRDTSELYLCHIWIYA